MRRSGIGFRSAIALTAGIVGVSAATTMSAAASAPAPLPTMAFVAQHEWAAGQPTATGRQLIELEVVAGRVWAGYGDYGANTGPITLASIDPASADGFVPAFSVDSEAVYNLEEINGAVVAPATDPRQAADFAIGEPWTQARPLGATHVYDATTLNGSDLWMVGSKGRDAVAWRSLDGGSTWIEAQRIAPWTGTTGEYVRFYFAAVIDGRLFVQARSSTGANATTSKVFDGLSWSDGPSMLPSGAYGWNPRPYAEGVVFHQIGHGYSGDIYYFDGQTSRAIARGTDVEVSEGAVWVLDDSDRIVHSTDLATFREIAQAPVGAVSLAVDGNSLYVGTASSDLWSLPVPDPPATTTTTTTSTPDIDPGDALPADRGKSSGGGGGRKTDIADRCPTGWQKKGRCEIAQNTHFS